MEPMSIDDSAALETSGTDRSIESGRLMKALTRPMAIERVAPRQYDVTHDGTTRTVDIETGSCSCADYKYRGERFVCKHVLRAAIHAVFTEGVRTRLQARIVAATREAGCPHAHGSITDEHDCEGPLGRGAFPCPDCVRCSPGEWSAWVALVGDGPDASATVDRGEGIATDGGRHTPPQSTCDHGITETDYIERSDGQHKVIVCATCNLILEDCGVPEPDVCTDGGTVTLHPCSTCDGQAEGDAEQCPECQRRGVSEVDEDPL